MKILVGIKKPLSEVLINKDDYEFIKKSNLSIIRRRISKDREIRIFVWDKNKNIKPITHFLLNPAKGFLVDHINGNTLDNRRINLRICTHKQNMQNVRSHKDSKSKYKGVHKQKGRNLFEVKVRNKRIGSFRTEKEAAKAYNEKAKEIFGEFAKLNKV